MTIEHDPEAITRGFAKLPQLIPPHVPLTTTCSDTNIPNSNLTVPEEKSFGSTNSVHNEIVQSVTSAETAFNKTKPAGNGASNKERLFKRRDEGYMSGTRSRQLRRRNQSTESRQSLDKERSSSMSRLLDE